MVSRYTSQRTDPVVESAAQRQLLQEWALWQRVRSMADKTITDRLTVIRRMSDAASITPQGVDPVPHLHRLGQDHPRQLPRRDPGLVQMAHRHRGRTDDPNTIATIPKVKKGRPRPVADQHLALQLGTKIYRLTGAMILLATYAGLRVSEIASVRGDDIDTVIHTITVIGNGDKRRQIPLHPIVNDLAADMPMRSW